MFVMLEKKLQELESELDVVFRLPPDQMAAEHDDIKERFRFLDKLRAAEGGSQHPQNSDQLRDIDDRIERLKAAFSRCMYMQMQFRNDDDDEDDAPSICSDCTPRVLLPLQNFSGQKSSEKEEKKVAGRKWKYCGAFGGGVIIGAVCMFFKLFSADYLILGPQPFLIPPT